MLLLDQGASGEPHRTADARSRLMAPSACASMASAPPARPASRAAHAAAVRRRRAGTPGRR